MKALSVFSRNKPIRFFCQNDSLLNRLGSNRCFVTVIVVNVRCMVMVVGFLFMHMRMTVFLYRIIMHVIMMVIAVAMSVVMLNCFMSMSVMVFFDCGKIGTKHHYDKSNNKRSCYGLVKHNK